jgi:hypothetical protein
VCDERPLQDAVLALMHLNAHEDAFGWRAWKSFPWEATDRFHERGLIDDPRTRAKSVALTAEGARLAGQLFAELFGVEDAGSAESRSITDLAASECGKPRLTPGACPS